MLDLDVGTYLESRKHILVILSCMFAFFGFYCFYGCKSYKSSYFILCLDLNVTSYLKNIWFRYIFGGRKRGIVGSVGRLVRSDAFDVDDYAKICIYEVWIMLF